MITHEELRSIMDYDPDTGRFIWKYRPKLTKWWNDTYVGRPVSQVIKKGYATIEIKERGYMAHRLVWLWVNGEWPDVIDHLDFNKVNNRISNLRSVTNAENSRRKQIECGSSTGHRGVYEVVRPSGLRRWAASVQADGKWTFRVFETLDEAVARRKQHDDAVVGT